MREGAVTITQADARLLLPEQLTDDLTVDALLHAFDATLREVAADIPGLAIYAQIDTVPEAVLDELAWALHVDYYRPTMALETKRAMVQQSIALHRRAGSRAAMEDYIGIIWGTGANIVEWFEADPPMQPGTFRIELSGALAEIDFAEFVASLTAVKRAGDWVVIYSQATMANAVTAYVGAGALLYQHYALEV